MADSPELKPFLFGPQSLICAFYYTTVFPKPSKEVCEPEGQVPTTSSLENSKLWSCCFPCSTWSCSLWLACRATLTNIVLQLRIRFKHFSLLLRKSVGNNSISFAFSVDSKRTERHLKLNAVSVGLFITSTACCQKLVLVVGKLVVGLSEITEASCLKNNVMYKARGQVPELSWFSVFSL